jgi:hypothetical protein
LFKELPLYLWQPSASEIAVIRDWLLNHNLTAVKNKLACVILEGLNWGFAEQVRIKLETGKSLCFNFKRAFSFYLFIYLFMSIFLKH